MRSVYYFSSMKLIVSTFLVYKVKKCLLKSGKVTFAPNKSYYLGIRCPTMLAAYARGLFC